MGIRDQARAAITVLAISVALTGCAELATIAPAVSVDAAAIRRVRASTTVVESESWSWGLGVRVIGALDGPAIPIAREPRDHTLRLDDARPCRVPALCVWEARTRARALTRAWELARQESER